MLQPSTKAAQGNDLATLPTNQRLQISIDVHFVGPSGRDVAQEFEMQLKCWIISSVR